MRAYLRGATKKKLVLEAENKFESNQLKSWREKILRATGWNEESRSGKRTFNDTLTLRVERRKSK